MQQLTKDSRFNHAPAWSPNGTWIAFEHYLEADDRWAIMLMDSNGDNLRQLYPDGHHPTWSKNGQYIAFEYKPENSQSSLGVIKIDGSNFKVIQEISGLEPAWYQAN